MTTLGTSQEGWEIIDSGNTVTEILSDFKLKDSSGHTRSSRYPYASMYKIGDPVALTADSYFLSHPSSVVHKEPEWHRVTYDITNSGKKSGFTPRKGMKTPQGIIDKVEQLDFWSKSRGAAYSASYRYTVK